MAPERGPTYTMLQGQLTKLVMGSREALVEYRNTDEASQCIELLSEQEVHGRRLKITRASPAVVQRFVRATIHRLSTPSSASRQPRPI